MATLAELLKDKRFREDVGNNARDFLQSASNAAANQATIPIDAISWLLRKGGVPIPEAPVFSSQWAKNAGLMAEPKDPKSLASLLGDAAGNIAPMVGYQKMVNLKGKK